MAKKIIIKTKHIEKHTSETNENIEKDSKESCIQFSQVQAVASNIISTSYQTRDTAKRYLD